MTANSAPQHLFATMLARVHAAAAAVLGPDADLSRIVVEPPRDASHGDMATNAAMVLAKDAGLKPRDLADKIAEALRADDLVDKVDIAGPGFINLTLKPHVWGDALRAVLEQGKDYGRSTMGAGQKINVEYVSANPTGPLHVGHGRGAVFGDALASLLAFAGYDVTREYYINDAGAQVDVLARSAFLRYREALGEDIGEIPDGLYPGDYLKECGERTGQGIWRQARQNAGSRMAADRAAARHRHDDGRDPQRSRQPAHRAGRVLFRAFADRRRVARSVCAADAAVPSARRCRRRHHRPDARARPCL